MANKYAICYNQYISNSSAVLKELVAILHKYNIKPEIFDVDNLKSGYDFIFVIGGDGTILKSARYYSEFNTSIFGINLGHLGFLSQVSVPDLENAVDKIVSMDYKIEKRLMLQINNCNALNDFVIKGAVSSRASVFKLEIDDNFVCEYFADGIIISTPTGTTAYNMAAGGPIVAPDVEVLTIVPICPHTFTARPLVVSSDSMIKISSPPRQVYSVSSDGQEVFSFTDEIIVSKSKYYANLVLLNNNDFYSVLRGKLHWGISPRDDFND